MDIIHALAWTGMGIFHALARTRVRVGVVYYPVCVGVGNDLVLVFGSKLTWFMWVIELDLISV